MAEMKFHAALDGILGPPTFDVFFSMEVWDRRSRWNSGDACREKKNERACTRFCGATSSDSSSSRDVVIGGCSIISYLHGHMPANGVTLDAKRSSNYFDYKERWLD